MTQPLLPDGDFVYIPQPFLGSQFLGYREPHYWRSEVPKYLHPYTELRFYYYSNQGFSAAGWRASTNVDAYKTNSPLVLQPWLFATMESIPLLSVIIASMTILLWTRRLSTRSFRFPPGPKGYPIIGNSLEIPLDEPWKAFSDWSKVYGPFRSPSPLQSSLESIAELQVM